MSKQVEFDSYIGEDTGVRVRTWHEGDRDSLSDTTVWLVDADGNPMADDLWESLSEAVHDRIEQAAWEEIAVKIAEEADEMAAREEDYYYQQLQDRLFHLLVGYFGEEDYK